jgi:ubiquinol-cytochrome c reductase cytochrome c1 subunit
MRFAKLALSSLAVIAVAAFGVTAIAQQPAAPVTPPPAADQPAVTPAPTAEPVVVAPAPTPVAEVIQPENPEAAEAALHGGGASHHLLEPKGGWPHEELFGTLDQNAMQRGFKVYKNVCSTCHGLRLLSFRNLGEVGGPFYDARFPNPNDNPIVKKLASEFSVSKVDPDSGSMVSVPGIPSDRFPSPYANNIAASVANGGAIPPDLSVIAKARHGGAAYIYSLMNGFVTPPAGLKVNPGQNYNVYVAGDTGGQWSGDPRHKPPGGFLAMQRPLSDFDIRLQRDCSEHTAGGMNCDKNTFDDGRPTTMEQQAHDVALFLAWAGDPKQVARKQMGAAVIPYLLILALLAFLSYRRLWRNVEH